MKTIEYHGKTFTVPDWATHIASDDDGVVHVFDAPPRYRAGNDGCYVPGKVGGAYHEVGAFDKRQVMEIPMSSKKSNAVPQTLTQFLNVPGLEIGVHIGRQLIREFAERFPLEVTVEGDWDSASFTSAGGDVVFEVRHDLNESLNTVFEGKIMTFCPERVQYCTGYKRDLSEVLAELAKGAQRMFNSTKAKPRAKK